MKQQQQQQQQQNPSWEDLNPFILSKIFSCLSTHDQLFGPPYVCHSWLSATLETLFRNSILDLRLIDTLDEENQRSRFTHLLKLAINHYKGWVSIYFPSKHIFGYFATVYIAEKTPSICSVILPPHDVYLDSVPIYISLFYWRNLRIFKARLQQSAWLNVLLQLAEFCKNIIQIGIYGKIDEKEVVCIVERFPLLEVLDFSESDLGINALRIVLDGRLKCLKELNILHCSFVGHDQDEKDMGAADYMKSKAFKCEILEKASALKSLKRFRHCFK